jgi:hypothetical protein
MKLYFLFHFIEEHVTQRFSPPPSSFETTTNPEASTNGFETYDVSTNIIQTNPIAPPVLKSFLSSSIIDNSPTTSTIFTVQKQTTSIDYEDSTQNIIMNHLHSVKSLKKFFETKMVIHRPIQSMQTAPITTCSQAIPTMDEQKLDRSSIIKEQKSTDELEQRQEMMNKVLESLKKKKVYSRMTNGKII